MTFTCVKVIEVDDINEVVKFERQNIHDGFSVKFTFEKKFCDFTNIEDISSLKDGMAYMFEIYHTQSFDLYNSEGEDDLEKLKSHLNKVGINEVRRLKLLSECLTD